MKRIQRQRRKGWKMPPNTVYVGRPTKWANPYRIEPRGRIWAVVHHRDGLVLNVCKSKEEAQRAAVRAFERYALLRSDRAEWLAPLRGRNLACWCKPGTPCHADVLLEMIHK